MSIPPGCKTPQPYSSLPAADPPERDSGSLRGFLKKVHIMVYFGSI